MGSLKKFIAAAGVTVALSAGGAHAADYSDAFLEPILPVEIGSTWYLRGDIGYKVYSSPDATYTLIPGNFVFQAVDESIDNAFLIGGGVGYQFNPWFRSDITVDYEAPADFTGRVPCPFVTCGSAFSNATGRISAWTILANAYIDLGTWGGLTPYVGGGIGTANVRLKDYRHTNPPLNPAGLQSIGSNASTWNFAWSLTAGASYAVTENWLVDMNYRYVSLGDVDTNDQWGDHIEVTDIAAHEFRIGARFLID
ncbi:outer membrane protein [Microbaculum marinisediminis]|uniref:Porin family protein n=1 Tax=Microbaculum marinisediminis TaxID=2931392 RepID=A0AAW5QVM2_9HYPH|nr:outer membrane protein [Microbaculum sp. A6E488]MCT8971748.1 porin family protein [Microbaculum sp. A6E488]